MYASVNAACIGCGACESLCPEVFRINSYNIAEAYTNPIPPDSEKSAQLSARSCPVSAIILE